MFYDLASTSWDSDEIQAIQRVLDNGMLTIKTNVRCFEQVFARKFDVKHTLMLGSGSAANLVGVAALIYRSKNPLQRGDEAIVPTIS